MQPGYYSLGDNVEILFFLQSTLPDDHNAPSDVTKFLKNKCVMLLISFEFFLPEFVTRSWHNRKPATMKMPETAMNKNHSMILW